MTPIHFPEVTHRLGQPAGWDEESFGVCHTLPVQLDQASGYPVWTVKYIPSDEEISRLIAGEPITLSILAKAVSPIELKVGD